MRNYKGKKKILLIFLTDERNYQSRILYLVIYIRNEFRIKAFSDEDKQRGFLDRIPLKHTCFKALLGQKYPKPGVKRDNAK